MLAKLKQYLWGSIFRRGATLLTVLTFGSYLLGLVRDMLFAREFGASRILDIYNAAFVIPDLMLNIFVAGALTAAFIPMFSQLETLNEQREAENVASTMLYGAPLAMMIIGIIAAIFMPWLSHLVAPGFSGDDLKLLILMSRIMLLSPVIFALSNTLGNMLVSHEKFWSYGLAPILYNVGNIAGVPLTHWFGPLGLIYGSLGGAVLHVAVRWIETKRTSFRLRHPNFGNPNFLKILKLMIPRMAGQPIEQLIFFIFTNIASTLFAGAIAVLSFARNFQSVPISLFGVSFSTAVFASLSRKAALADREGFNYHFKETAKALAITTGLSAIFYILFGQFIVKIFLGGGRFGAEDIAATGKLLAIFALSIPAESFIYLLSRGFYALKDTWTPILVTLPGLVLITFLAKYLAPLISLPALPWSYAIVFNIQAIILYILLKKKISALG